jgi:hypothetical protein
MYTYKQNLLHKALQILFNQKGNLNTNVIDVTNLKLTEPSSALQLGAKHSIV